MRLTMLLLLLVVLAGLIAGAVGLWGQEPTVDEIREQVLQHREDLHDYSATLQVTTGSDASPGKTFVQVKTPCRYRLDHIGADGKPDLIEIFNGSMFWRIRPGTGAAERIVAQRMLCDRFAREDYQQVVPRIVAENAILYLGVEGVNGSRAHVVEASPGDLLRYMDTGFTRMRAWIDASTWMVDKVEFYDDAGNVVLSVEYANIAVNTGIPESTFTPSGDAAGGSPSLIPVLFPG